MIIHADVSNNVKKAMTRFLPLLLTIIFLLFECPGNGQTVTDSATYWVNDKYISCLDSGKSVCHCQEQNNLLILHIDTIKNIVTIDPSIYFSWETFEINIKHGKINTYSIIPSYGMDNGSVMNINGNQLILTSPKQAAEFTKIKVKKIDKWLQGDMWRQIGVINCKPLLKYSITICNDSSNISLTKKELADYIMQGKTTISCSDDFHYNEMHIKDADKEFFLLYEIDSIKMYEEPLRDRDQKIDITKLKNCQLFYLQK
jgi:hypothetical protein